MISQFVIINLLLSLLVMVTLLVISVYWAKKHQLFQRKALLYGVLFFVVAVMILEPILHQFVLTVDQAGQITLAVEQPLLYIIYGILAAGIFEEVARFIAFNLLKKDQSTFGTALSYGIGHGGIEVILVGMMSVLSLLILSVSIQNGDSELINQLGESYVTSLAETPAYMYLMIAFERILAFMAQILLSIYVWSAVQRGNDWKRLGSAILLHAVFNLPAAMYQVGWITNLFILYGSMVILLGLMVYYIYSMVKSEIPTIMDKRDKGENK